MNLELWSKLFMMTGFFLGIIAMFFSGFGVLFMKKGIDSLARYHPRDRFFVLQFVAILFKNKFWFVGGVFLIISWFLRIIAVTMADLSYVRTILDAHLAIVVIGSSLWIKEKLTRFTIFSTLIIIIGLFFLYLGPSLTRNPQVDLNALFYFILIFTGLGIVIFIISLHFKNIQKFCFGICTAIFFANGVLMQAFFSANLLNINDLFSISFYVSMFVQPILYFVLLFTLMGFIFSNLMVSKFNLSIIYPISHPLSEIVVLLGSIIIFGDNVSITSNPFRFIAVSLTLAGLCLLSVTNRKYLFNANEHP
jgi:hypothetical protein